MKDSEVDWKAILENAPGIAEDLMDARARRDDPVSLGVDEARAAVASMRRTAVFLALSADRLERVLSKALAAGNDLSFADACRLVAGATDGPAFHAFKLKH